MKKHEAQLRTEELLISQANILQQYFIFQSKYVFVSMVRRKRSGGHFHEDGPLSPRYWSGPQK